MYLPLTKFLHPFDFEMLRRLLPVEVRKQVLDGEIEGQHPMRKWEYGMAMKASCQWLDAARYILPWGTSLSDWPGGSWLDVGGAGSPFSNWVTELTPFTCEVLDPKTSVPIESYAGPAAYVITAISTIEHTTDDLAFLRACIKNLRPGGLLFLTTDCWDGQEKDTAHFHWMRERIYTERSFQALVASAERVGLRQFGGADYHYHGAQVYDYTFGCATFVREDPRP